MNCVIWVQLNGFVELKFTRAAPGSDGENLRNVETGQETDLRGRCRRNGSDAGDASVAHAVAGGHVGFGV